jgi:hypothetical protein
VSAAWFATVALGIDNRCGPVPANDIKAGYFLHFPPAFYVNSSYGIKAAFINNGTSPQTNVPVKLLINGVQQGAVQTIPNLPAGSSDTSLTFPWTPSAQGYTQVALVSALASDTVRYNDTLKTSVFVLPVSASLSSLTICRNNLNRPTLDYNIIRDTITPNISGAGYLVDVNVKIDTLGHTWDADLSLMLHHTNVVVSLISYRGGSGDNFLHTVLNDSASLSISQGTAPFNGSYRPEQPFSAFNGLSPSGQWILEIMDAGGGDTGNLRAWCLTFVYYTITGGINGIQEIPDNFSLSQNYPNPFNPATSIKYQISSPAYVKLIVYDILGRVAAVPIDGFVKSANNEIIFDGSDLASGLYFYKITAGNYTKTRKMVLMK